MSGNARQRKQVKDHKELVNLGRAQKDLIDEHQRRLASKDSEIEALKQQLYTNEVECARRGKEIAGAAATIVELRATLRRFDEDSASEVARLQGLLDREKGYSAEYVRRHRAMQDDLHAAQAKLASFEADGAISRKEHKAAVAAETATLRTRMRRQREVLLRAHVLFNADPKKAKALEAELARIDNAPDVATDVATDEV